MKKKNIMEENDLSKSVKEDNDFYKQMLDLIPPTFYFTQEARDQVKFGKDINTYDQDPDAYEHDLSVGQKRQNPNPVSKAEIKRAKYDPSQAKTVTQIQEELIVREAPPGKKKKKKNAKQTEEEVNLKSAGENLEHLREKLQQKIDGLKAKRKALNKNDRMEMKKMKRRASKLKMKLKQKSQKDNKTKGLEKVSPLNGMLVKKGKSSSPAKPVFNKEGKMVFSKFDFTESGTKHKSEMPSGKNYKKLLENVEKQKEMMDKLKETDKEAAKILQEKTAWKKAVQKAEGVKVKDNPELLKKSIRKKEKRKQKSRNEWKERQEKIEERMKERQDKRQRNIKMRKQDKIHHKIKKSRKKGRTVPGF